MNPRDAVITGIGLVSSLGEGVDAHWQRLSAPDPRPTIDAESFSPYLVHPLPPIDWSLQIPKRGDQRQMETWQRLGTYAAGLALDDAGAKGDEEACATMDMIVAAAGGERDVAVDTAILEAGRARQDRDLLINEKLTTELRPTLFLAQLSNLMAGNISIVHKVTGSSRTFMGEEGAGISAIETAVARIRAGQSTHVLVGGAFQTEHPDMLLGYELAGYLHRGPHASVWDRSRGQGGGVVTGSGAAFLVLESRERAEAAGRRAYATIASVASARTHRLGAGLQDALAAMIAGFAVADRPVLAISGASGAHRAASAERAALDDPGNIATRGFSTMTGHLKEAQFPFAVALAALAIHKGAAYPPFDAAREAAFEGAPETALATTVGYHRFEGAAVVSKA